MITDISIVSDVVRETESNAQQTEEMAGKINDQADTLKDMAEMFNIKHPENKKRMSGSEPPQLRGKY
jgi:methyl-accepting chemotaxis protein